MKEQDMNYKLFEKADIAVMSPVTRKLDALLKADGFSLLGAGRIENSGTFNDTTVNNLEYMRGEWEKVFVITHEKPAGGGDGV
jgi:hypothetical protein